MHAEIVAISWPISEANLATDETLHVVHTTGGETREDLEKVVDDAVDSHPDCVFRRLTISVSGDPVALMGSICRIESLASFPLSLVAIRTERDTELQ